MLSSWKHGEIGRKCSILTNAPRSTTRRRTSGTKQNLDPRCTYVQTRVKILKLLHGPIFHILWKTYQSFSDVRVQVRVRGLLWSPSPKFSGFENPSVSDSACLLVYALAGSEKLWKIFFSQKRSQIDWKLKLIYKTKKKFTCQSLAVTIFGGNWKFTTTEQRGWQKPYVLPSPLLYIA
jgi:hypothetical protein